MEVVDMYLTIQKVIRQFGIEIIQSKRFVFLLDDYCAFNNEPKPIRKILKDMADLGFIVELYRIGEWNAHCYSLCQRYIDTTGVREDYTKHVFKALAKGFGWNLHSIKDENENNFESPKPLPRLSIDKTVPSSNKNIELDHLDYISRNAVNTSKYNCIKNIHVLSKGTYPLKELRILFLLSNMSPYDQYKFYYSLINYSGTVLEKNTIVLKPSPKTLKCIESVGRGIFPTDIARIEYGIILGGKEGNLDSSKPLSHFSENQTISPSHNSIEQKHLDYISRNAVNTSKFDCIKYFQVSSKGDYPHNELRISFLLPELSPYHTYAFYYCLINPSGTILEKDTISLKPSSKTLRCIESVGCGLSLTDITRIEYGIILEGIIAQFNYS